MLKVLVACEYSGRVRDAFIKRGHFAMSCDLLPSETPGFHYQGDVLEILDLGWDLMICHPPCTHLAISGARHFKEKRERAVFSKKPLNLFESYSTRQFLKSVLKTRSASLAPKSVNLTKLFNRGNSDTVKPRQPVYGLKDFPNSIRLRLSVVGKRVYTEWHLDRTDGKNAAELIKASLTRWQNNGVM